MEEYYPYIRECIQLAEQAKALGNHPFGSIIVHDGEILLKAINTIYSENDLAQHPEIVLARAAASKYDPVFLAECTLYTSTEPCAMCTGAIYWSGIGRIVFACSEARLSQMTSGGLHISCRDILAAGERSVEVIGPVLEDEAVKVHLGFWDRT